MIDQRIVIEIIRKMEVILMMRKGRNIFIINLLFVLFVLISVSLASEETIKLTLADNTGPTGLRGEALNLFLEEVKKHTNGEVQIDVFWAESLLKGREILKGVQDGIVDIGFINTAYYPGQLVVNSSIAIFPRGPVQYNYVFEVNTRIIEEIPEFIDELQDFNQKLLYYYPSTPMAVACKEPIESLEDFKGKRIRAPGSWFLMQLEDAGAVPVSVPWGDTYMALQTGTIDGVYTGLESLHRAKLEEVAPNIFTMKELWGATIFLYTVNMDKFNTLPENIQLQLIDAGKAASLRFGELYDAEWDRIIKEQEELSCNITFASPEDIEKWMSMPVIDQMKEEWIKSAQENGVENPEQIVDKIDRIINKVVEKEQIEKN